MNEVKLFETMLCRFTCNVDRKFDPVVKDVFNFWYHYDALFYTNHYNILQILGSPSAERLTAAGIAMRMHICDRTLSRYRKLYFQSYTAFRGIEIVPLRLSVL